MSGRVKESVRIPGAVQLEGLFEVPEGSPVLGGVVVAHPHPLYGGTMIQPVVHHLARACRDAGLAVLRFNFRGVGSSAGRFDGLEERHDVAAAATFLRERVGPERPLGLAGYSFGAVMAALTVAQREVAPEALALVALAVGWDEFMPSFLDPLAGYQKPVLALCGEVDDIAPPAEVAAALEPLGLDLRVEVLPGAGHLFTGRQRELGALAAGFFVDVFARKEGT